MAKKRTKLEVSQRQADTLEKRAEVRPEQTPKKRAPDDFSQPAASVVKQTTEKK